MSEFEDNLWLLVMREHGDELARASGTMPTHRRATRGQLLAGTTVGVAALGTAAAVLFSASTSPPAFAVTRNPNGTVTVNLMKASGIASANERLAAMGVRAQIVALDKHAPNLVCPGGTAPTITFDPASVPSRRVLMITPGQPSAGKTGRGDTGTGVNHVVRTISGAGKIRTQSGGGNHVVRMYCP